MIMTSTTHHDLDAEKQRYANELAAYTRRQWDVARRSLELNQSRPKENGSQSDASSSSSQSSSTRGSQGTHFYPIVWDGCQTIHGAGMQSRDYAHRSHMRGGSMSHESRAVAA